MRLPGAAAARRVVRGATKQVVGIKGLNSVGTTQQFCRSSTAKRRGRWSHNLDSMLCGLGSIGEIRRDAVAAVTPAPTATAFVLLAVASPVVSTRELSFLRCCCRSY